MHCNCSYLICVDLPGPNNVQVSLEFVQSNFNLLLPSRKDKLLVTSKVVDIHGDAADKEMFNISYMITPTPVLMKPSYSGKQMEVKEQKE